MLKFESASEFNERLGAGECWHLICVPHAAADRFHLIVYRCCICYELFEDVHCSIPGGDDLFNPDDISCAYTKARTPMEYTDLSNIVSELSPIPSVMTPNELAEAVLDEMAHRAIRVENLSPEQLLITTWEISKELTGAR